MNTTRMISRYNFSSRNGNGINWIVIHDVGTTSTALNNANYFNTGDRGASAHYFVDDDNVIQIVEDYNASWHCGDGYGQYGITNQNSIGIEMCLPSGDVTAKTEYNTIQLVKDLIAKYGLSPDDVVRHYDASRKNCPGTFSANNWARWWSFKDRLSKPDIPIMTFDKQDIYIQAHIQDIGWQDWKNGNELVGTVGESKRIEAIRIKLGTPFKASNIKYRLHIQNEGWHNWNTNGDMNGTEGKSLRAEAIQIELTGNIALDYDVVYRVHVQDIGWQEWYKNGEVAGTTGKGLRMEALQVILVKK